VTSFKEKAKIAGRASAGFFVLNRRVFNYLGGARMHLREGTAVSALPQERQLMAYQHDGFFYAMDTYREYEYLNSFGARSRRPGSVWAGIIWQGQSI